MTGANFRNARFSSSSSEYYLDRSRDNSGGSSPDTSKANTMPSSSKRLEQHLQGAEGGGKYHQTWGEFRLQAPPPERHNSEQTTDQSTISISSDDHRGNGYRKSSHSRSSSSASTLKVVALEAAEKSYGGKTGTRVLDKLDMTVEKGIIYGLLGASGCGKTTVLSCIVGRRYLDHGHIEVFGGTPGDRSIGIPGNKVGYMPQELALFPEFTIGETLQYFGRIYGMDQYEIKSQMKKLMELLDLPEKNRRIKALSGGQQRRVSFAISLLHNPELLILDEPTVGVDPMLRQKIWSYLLELVNREGKTIILTTHYIEEARQANIVGLMRNGRLLAEAPPDQLLTEYGLPTLEDVFLKLCVKDENGRNSPVHNGHHMSIVSNLFVNGGGGTGTGKRNKGFSGTSSISSATSSVVYPGITANQDDVSIQPISYLKRDSHDPVESEFQKIKRRLSMKKRPSMKLTDSRRSSSSTNRASCCQWTWPTWTRTRALMVKNFTKMKRNISQLCFVFLLPAIQVVFFCVAIGRDPSDLSIAVVNHEVPYSSNRGSNSTTGYNCTAPVGCDFTDLSCRVLDHLFDQKTLIPTYYETDAEALTAVKEGKAWGRLSLPANFSRNFLKRLWSSIDADQETLNASTISVDLDQSNQQVTFILLRSLRDGFDDFYQGLLTDCEFPEGIAENPLVIGDPIYGPKRPNFTEFMAPGIIIIIIFFLAMALTGEIFIVEKRDGLLDRSWIAGVLPSEVLLSHVVTQFLTLAGQSAITLFFILYVFSIPCQGPILWLTCLTLLQGVSGMCYGLLISALFDDMAASMQFCIGSFYPSLLLSGILWPVEGMPWYLREVAYFMPSTAACQAMRDIISRGWDITEPSVYLGFVSTGVWIVVFIILAWTVIKLKSK